MTPERVTPDNTPDRLAAERTQRLVSVRAAKLAGLLLDARQGSRDALHEIVVELTPLLWQVARAQGTDRETSADAVQTTWLSLLRHLHRIHRPEALVSWLITATKREARRARDRDRRDQHGADELFDELPDPAPTPEDAVALSERRRLIWAEVQRLSPLCRELLRVVAYTHRPDYDVIAAALHVPRGTLGPNRGRCLAKLRAALSANPGWSWS